MEVFIWVTENQISPSNQYSDSLQFDLNHSLFDFSEWIILVDLSTVSNTKEDLNYANRDVYRCSFHSC